MLNSYNKYFENAILAGRKSLTPVVINQVLKELAYSAIVLTDYLLQENKKDLDRMDPADPKYDRLKLTPARIEEIARDINNVAKLASPLGKVLSKKTMP